MSTINKIMPKPRFAETYFFMCFMRAVGMSAAIIGLMLIVCFTAVAERDVVEGGLWLPEDVPPEIGMWPYDQTLDPKKEFEPGGYRKFIDLVAPHSPIRIWSLVATRRAPAEITDPAIHDWVKAAVAYARERGLSTILELDLRNAREAFRQAYPEELQEMLHVVEADLSSSGEVKISVVSRKNFGDCHTLAPVGVGGFFPLSGRLLRIYSYVQGAEWIEPETVKDITAACRVDEASQNRVSVTVPCGQNTAGRKAAMLAAFTHHAPDIFAPICWNSSASCWRLTGTRPPGGAVRTNGVFTWPMVKRLFLGIPFGFRGTMRRRMPGGLAGATWCATAC